ncbi:MAG: HD domain-containing protein [Phycisphaerales bacterium]|nr:HD domain-containing protein [Phycisphaerales bacterium]
MQAEPSFAGPAEKFFKSPALRKMVAASGANWLKSRTHEVTELLPGCYLVPLPEIARRRVVAVDIAMLLSDAALNSREFIEICRSARLDAFSVRQALADIASYDEQSARRVAELLAWNYDDLSRIVVQDETIDSFSSQLSESYEEITLLYKLGESMTELIHPERFIQMACRELHSSLPFAWVAARFVDDRASAGAVADKTITVGTPPCEQSRFEGALRMALTGIATERVILEGADRGVLGAGESQVILCPVMREGAPIGLVALGNKRAEDNQVNNGELKLLQAAAGHMGVLLSNASLYEQQQAMFLGTLEALTAAIDAKDPYTCGHSERVAYLAGEIAAEFGLHEHEADRVRIAGLVHDIGKIGVPEAVLRKPGRLTDEEFGLIKLHPQIGFQILKDIPLLDDVLPGVLYHHERFDGRGYPFSVSGENIPLVARMIGIADAFDAMSSSRTYRAAMDRTKVLAEIRRGAGSQFDERLVEAFLRIDLAEYDRMVSRHGSSEATRIGTLIPKERAA